MKLFVLWFFFTPPWHFGPVPMTPGWFSAAVLDPVACVEATERASSPAICLPPGWMLDPVSQFLRENEGLAQFDP